MRVRPALVALNVVLLVLLVLVTATPGPAQQPQARARGEYTMVAGEVTGPTPHAVFIVDSANGEVIALRWDNSRNVFHGLGYRDLAADAKIATQGGPR